jgi:hypothetical protein
MGKDVTNELIEDSQTNDNGATQRIVKSNRSVDELPDAVPTTLQQIHVFLSFQKMWEYILLFQHLMIVFNEPSNARSPRNVT